MNEPSQATRIKHSLRLRDSSRSRLDRSIVMTTHDQEYYSRRERQERERAARSPDNTAKQLHLELAERYSALLGERLSIAPVIAA